MWSYIAKKIGNNGENEIDVSPLTVKDAKRMNEETEIETLIKELQQVIEDADTLEDDRKQAEMTIKMLKLKPMQNQMRSEVLSRYQNNQVSLYSFRQQTQGDHLFERQLVDREFYKRAKIYASSKKEARTLDRFEQQMRSGQELRKKTRHREFLNEILQHTKDFTDFHQKKKMANIRKKAILVKASLESKEKKEQM